MVAAFHGGVEGADQWVNNSDLLTATRLAMDFWFENDFTNIYCLDAGGTAACREFDYIQYICWDRTQHFLLGPKHAGHPGFGTPIGFRT